MAAAATSDGASATPGLHVAIVGGGITGVMLGLGLERRGVSYTIYERAAASAEIGAGIGFSPNAERAMALLCPSAHATYKAVASSTGGEEEYFTWVDGHGTNEVVARLLIGVDAFQGGRRCDFVRAWGALLPEGRQRFGKEVDALIQRPDGKVTLTFTDRSEAEADIVIGSDGVRSRVRQLMLGADDPASRPGYTHKYCYRALLPMAAAVRAVGAARTRTRFMYNGPGAHAITYAVAGGTLLNALFVVSDPDPWDGGERHTATGTRRDVADAFAGWHPAVRALVALLPDELDRWAIFDTHERPAPRYHAGCVALAGDAARTSGPHLGSGAGFGIEDALALCGALGVADEEVRSGRLGGGAGGSRAEMCRAALAAYDAVRYERGQWLPGATREAGELFQWRHPDVGSDPDKFLPRITRLFHTIWDNDVAAMERAAAAEAKRLVYGQADESPAMAAATATAAAAAVDSVA